METGCRLARPQSQRDQEPCRQRSGTQGGAGGPPHSLPPRLSPPSQDLMVGLDKKVWFIGDEVQEQREKLNLVYPLSRATVTNWDHMEKVGAALLGGLAHGPRRQEGGPRGTQLPGVSSARPCPHLGLGLQPLDGKQHMPVALRGVVMWLQDTNTQAPRTSMPPGQQETGCEAQAPARPPGMEGGDFCGA